MLEGLSSPYGFGGEGEGWFGYERQEGAALYRAYADAMPCMALGLRMYFEPTIRTWIDELPAGDGALIAKLAKGAPRGAGRTVITELLTRAVEGGPSGLVTAGTFAAFVGGNVDTPRARKAGPVQDRFLGLAMAADRIVRALVAYPAAIEPATEAMRQQEKRLLAAASRHLGV